MEITMRREEAIAGISYLVAATPGWTDDSLELYVKEAETYQDADAFMIACKNLAKHWSHPRRPFMYDINVAYQAELRNQEMDRALPMGDTGSIPDFKDGMRIAWDAYRAECKRQGREPNRAIFEKWLPAAAGEALG